MKKWLFLLLLTISAQAQFSKTHYIPPLSASQSVVPEDQYLYISTPSVTPVNFRITNLGSTLVEGTVSRNDPFVYFIGIGPATQLFTDRTEIGSVVGNRGFVVEAEDLIYVTARVIAGNGNQAGMLVSKGLAALGTQFRIGAMLNTLTQGYQPIHHTFISILATENNTTVTFSDITANVQLINDSSGNSPAPVVLNSGESYVLAVEGGWDPNRDGLIGTLVSSDKPIAVNCGSFGGTNGGMNNIDTGFDQIVSAERTGTEYIFIRSTGMDDVERVLVVAHEDDTQVFFNGNTSPAATLLAGEYMTFTGGDFDANGNLYVQASKKVFAYQSIGDNGRPDQANQELFFVPPLSCETPRIIDNIPDVELVGSRQFIGRVTIITEIGSALEFVVDGITYPLNGLPPFVNVAGPNPVTGNASYETYVITGLSGDVSVISTGQLYLASYGSSNAATFGGFYSGFTFKPEIAFDPIDVAASTCIPNITLSVSPITAFDAFQWYFNDAPIAGANSRSFVPAVPGYYYVSATISACGTTLISDKIPVSSCPADSDNDGSNDNIDFDFDQDGIANCVESLGDASFNLSNPLSGTINSGAPGTFTGSFPTAVGAPAAVPFTGYANGEFTSTVSPGKGNTVVYSIALSTPMSIALLYADATGVGSEATSESEFIISVPPNRTISVLNPDNQLLIDTNYDGIYESDILNFSSFEIRFRLNAGVLPIGTGTFSFRANDAASLTYTHRNLVDSNANVASFKIVAQCVAKDSDGDGIPDQLDLDSDNDTIPDSIEAQGSTTVAFTGNDADENGIDDVFGTGINADSDADGVPNAIDLDSDNDGNFDLTEGNSLAADTNNNGVADGTAGAFGTNGLLNSVESAGAISFTVPDTDSDGIFNYVDFDSDADGCEDVIEAGFNDANNDGQLDGIGPVSTAGTVVGAGGYTAPGTLYVTSNPIVITTQPLDNPGCEARSATFFVDAGAFATIQWQVSTDGGNIFSAISNGSLYTGANSATLTITNVLASMDGYQFRALIFVPGNTCGAFSDAATLSVNPIPPVIAATLVQCDLGTAPDGLTVFNLNQATSLFSADLSTVNVGYFTNVSDAENNVNALSATYANTSNPQQIFVRSTVIATGCYSISTLNLQVNLQPNINLTVAPQCDDDGIEDGFYSFDLTALGIPASDLRFFTTTDDALLEENAIVNPSGFQNPQPYIPITIYARTESGNVCTRIYAITLQVLPLPAVDANEELEPQLVCVNTPTFNTVIDAGLSAGINPADYTYQWYFVNTPIPGATGSELTVNVEGDYKVVVTAPNGCTKTRFVPVVVGSTAIIENIEVTDLVENNTILITLAPNSFGDYVYALDYPNAWQTSNFFANVPMGNHIVYVKDLNGCPIASQLVSVLGIPPYFTPNGDGYNDTWNVKGTGPGSEAGLTVKIFDRYGKFLKQIGALGEGWDGTFNGRPLPSDDYWYVVIFEDGTISRGHFTLKR